MTQACRQSHEAKRSKYGSSDPQEEELPGSFSMMNTSSGSGLTLQEQRRRSEGLTAKAMVKRASIVANTKLSDEYIDVAFLHPISGLGLLIRTTKTFQKRLGAQGEEVARRLAIQDVIHAGSTGAKRFEAAYSWRAHVFRCMDDSCMHR